MSTYRAACHRAGAGGPIETPVLAEQWSEYIQQQLTLYASGQRRNDVYMPACEPWHRNWRPARFTGLPPITGRASD